MLSRLPLLSKQASNLASRIVNFIVPQSLLGSFFRSQMGLLGTLGGLPGGSKGRIPRSPFSEPLGIRPPPPFELPFGSPRHDQTALVTIKTCPKSLTGHLEEGISAYMRAHLLTGGHICEVHWGISAYMRAYLLTEGHI